MEEKENPNKKIPVSVEEQKKIGNELEKGSLFAISLLSRIREREQNLDEALKEALEVPGDEENREGFRKAADYLKSRAEEFGIESNEDDS